MCVCVCVCVRGNTALLSLSKLPQGKFLHRNSPTSDLMQTQVAKHQQEWAHMTMNEMRSVFHQLATRGAEIQLGKLLVGGFHKPKQRHSSPEGTF